VLLLGKHVCCLIYADDIILIAKKEGDLQDMMDYVSLWCKKWRITINEGKTKVVHFRKKHKPATNIMFSIGMTPIDRVSQFKYLGRVLDEHLDFKANSVILADSSIIHKFKTMRKTLALIHSVNYLIAA
jgi:hypothetical protein